MYKHQHQNYCECVMSDNKRTSIRGYSESGDRGGECIDSYLFVSETSKQR